jgi:hypothetical protein
MNSLNLLNTEYQTLQYRYCLSWSPVKKIWFLGSQRHENNDILKLIRVFLIDLSRFTLRIQSDVRTNNGITAVPSITDPLVNRVGEELRT